MTLLEDLKKLNLRTDFSLREQTSFRVGGYASYFVCVDSRESLKEFLAICARYQMPFRVLGGGSNLLIADNLLAIPVVKLTGDVFRKIEESDETVYVGSSVRVSELLRWMLFHDRGGLESLAGVPATIGGALAMNASALGIGVADYLESADVMTGSGENIAIPKKEIRFLYRYSSLRDYVVTGAMFDFPVMEKEILMKKIRDVMRYRVATQELVAHTAGCIFKNPPGKSAGYLIEQTGLKGFHYNDAYISEKHANFIVNKGNATYNDVVALIRIVKDRVQQRTGILLEEEVVKWTPEIS